MQFELFYLAANVAVGAQAKDLPHWGLGWEVLRGNSSGINGWFQTPENETISVKKENGQKPSGV